MSCGKRLLEARGAAAISDAKTSLQSLAAAELHLAARVGRAAQRASATRREHSRRAAAARRAKNEHAHHLAVNTGPKSQDG